MVLARPQCSEDPVWVQELCDNSVMHCLRLLLITSEWHHKTNQITSSGTPSNKFITTLYKKAQRVRFPTYHKIYHCLQSELQLESDFWKKQMDMDSSWGSNARFWCITVPVKDEAAPVVLARYTQQSSKHYSCKQIPVLRCTTTPLAVA